MPEREVTGESTPPKTAQPPRTGSGAVPTPGSEGQACGISPNKVCHGRGTSGQSSFGDDELVRAGRAQRRRLIRQPLSPSEQEIMGLDQEGGSRPNPMATQ